MIFVTIGTTLQFDELVREMDRLAGESYFDSEVVCQIGNGTYEPKYCRHFRFDPNIDELVRQADVVVCHGGTGTILSLLEKGQPFVAVANPLADGKHQSEFLTRLSKAIDIVWTSNVADVGELVRRVLDGKAEIHKLCRENTLAAALKEVVTG
jgi:UDP-N-acetylglucosamine transferase subunit ALG13